jgi:hypothetical protein
MFARSVRLLDPAVWDAATSVGENGITGRFAVPCSVSGTSFVGGLHVGARSVAQNAHTAPDQAQGVRFWNRQ